MYGSVGRTAETSYIRVSAQNQNKDRQLIAMQEKLKVLDEAVELTEDEKAKDRERVQQRMQAAQQKQQEYNQVISEITANPEVFHKL